MLTQNGLVSQNNTALDYMKLNGEILTADEEKTTDIEKTIVLNFDQKLQIKWQHDPAKNNSKFTIDSIRKKSTNQTLKLKWDGDPINANQKGEEEIRILAMNKFEVLNIKAI